MAAVADSLHTVLTRQVAAVRSAEPQNVAKVDAAAKIVHELVYELGLGQFLNALIVDHKPRLLLHFKVGDLSPVRHLGQEVVLKVYGDEPRGEGPLQSAWRSRGLNVPDLHYGVRSGCSWLVLEYLSLRQLQLHSLDDVSSVTEELARLALVMHQKIPNIDPVLRPVAQVMMPRWDFAVEALRSTGHHIDPGWRERARRAYQSGDPRPLHGDLAATNVAMDLSSRLVMFDASALLGSAVFDAARWAARSASSAASADYVFWRWISIEQGDRRARYDDLLAAECILEAGSRKIVARRQVTSKHATSPERLLTLASELLS